MKDSNHIRSRERGRLVPGLASALVMLVGGLMLSAPASAQQQQQQQQQSQTQEPIEVADDELESFAEAHIEVQDVRAELQASLQQSENAEEAQSAQQEANAEMVEIIQDHDMTTERFSQIVNGINADPELQERFDEVVEELTEDEDDGGGGGVVR